jgi:hypothetical protein
MRSVGKHTLGEQLLRTRKLFGFETVLLDGFIPAMNDGDCLGVIISAAVRCASDQIR